MNGVSQGPQRGLVDGFRKRRVDMDGPGQVFQARAHLDRHGELGRELGDMGAHRLQPDHPMIGLARHDADKAARIAIYGNLAA